MLRYFKVVWTLRRGAKAIGPIQSICNMTEFVTHLLFEASLRHRPIGDNGPVLVRINRERPKMSVSEIVIRALYRIAMC